MKTYEDKLDCAILARERLGLYEHDKPIVQKIKDCLKNQDIPCLFAIDEGSGLNQDGIDSLLGQGSSTKTEGETGSHGLGHREAFGASDLRYVLYAGRNKPSKGEAKDIVAGHCILAAFHEEDGQSYTKDGYYVEGLQKNLFDSYQCSSNVPKILKERLPKLPETGSVVCVTGFNYFREVDCESVSDQVKKVCLVNFFVAIDSGRLQVEFQDSILNQRWLIDKGSIAKQMEEIKDSKLTQGNNESLSGKDAYVAWKAFNAPDNEISIRKGIKIRWCIDQQSKTKVHICRNGMWIEDNPRMLFPAEFNGKVLFQAVVLFEGQNYDGRPSEDAELIRKAEGTLHRNLIPTNLTEADRKLYNNLLKDIAQKLNEQIPQIKTEEHVPHDFFGVNYGVAEKEKRPTRLPKSRAPISPGPRKSRSDSSDSSSVPAPRPKAGTEIEAKTTLRPERNKKMIVGIKAQVKLETEVKQSDHIGVRVYLQNGTDESCNNPLPFEYVRLNSVEANESVYRSEDSEGDFEIKLPAKEFLKEDIGHLNLKIAFKDHSADDLNYTFALHFVKRKKPSKSSTKKDS